MEHWLTILIVIIIILLIILLYWTFKINQVNPTQPAEKFSFGRTIDDRIGLRYINNFLSSEECDHLVELSKDKFAPSKVINHDHDDVGHDRTSKSYYIPKSNDDIIKGIENRVSKMTGQPVSHIEGLQVVRYFPGDYFKAHYDWFHPPYRQKIKNQRLYTFFVYLNDVEDGGETEFPNLQQKFKPKKGHALFWQNCTSIDDCFNLSLHQGSELRKGMKLGLNIWINFKPLY